MSTSIRSRIRFRLAACFATAAAAGIVVTGLPAFQGTADAAPGKIRCDEKFLGRKYNTDEARGIQGKNTPYSQNPEDTWGDYFFDNPSHAFDGMSTPDQAKLDAAGKTEDDVQKWKKKYGRTGDPQYRALEIYARYNKQLVGDGPRKMTDFRLWLDQRVIGNEANQRKGDGFESRIVKQFKLVGPDWICQKEVPVFDKNGKAVINPKTGEQAVRKYDAYNAKTKEFVEFKSNGKHIAEQLRWDKHILRNKEYADHKLRLITGDETTGNTKRQYASLNRQLQSERGTSLPQATIREQRANGHARWTPNRYTRYDKVFNPDPRRVGSYGPLHDDVWRSAKSPEQARKLQHQYNQVNTRGGFGRPGGIDFSTLELQYVGNPTKGKGLDYSFKADMVEDEDKNPGWGGEQRLQLSSDAMFAWLTLTPDKFWVNLNPDQPDKIMDRTFGKTDAGRVLLQADLEMKHDYARDMDPRSGIGKQYWDAMTAANIPCGHQIRLWIVPKTAKVRADNNGLYILDAPLKVNAEPQKVNFPSPNGKCDLTEAQINTSQRLVEQYVIPDVEEKVNSGSAYADLRRVYNARVAAEYIRTQDKGHVTDFRPIINSNNVARWPLRGKARTWTPKQTWDEYMKSYTQGDYSYPCQVDGQNKTCIMGGVDFSKAPKRNISKTEFNLQHPRTDTTTKTSRTTTVTYRNSNTVMFGGSSSGQVYNGGGNETPGPKPTGTAKPTSKPTHQPTTPAPDPSDSRTPAPTGSPEDPDGNLAHTGSDTPVGLIASVAAALAVGGAGLTWWMRRRKAAAS
ncbi:PT domain-containing protein [Streptomyces sp. NPDC056227]|uniref:PT domain-containing protein n=1 Tax=Streptomyces sp. NPDC056227 TaxID=3345753 RepID=UPI0035DADAB4